MKKSVILDIFNGDRGNIDSMQKPKENENEEIVNYNDEFKENLSPELYALYDKHINSIGADWLKEVDRFFVEGFKLGLRIGIECMDD